VTTTRKACPARRPRNPHAAKINADPAMRAKVEAAASAAMKRWWDGRRLPPMTPAQRWKYRTIREALGRDAALREVVGS